MATQETQQEQPLQPENEAAAEAAAAQRSTGSLSGAPGQSAVSLQAFDKAFERTV